MSRSRKIPMETVSKKSDKYSKRAARTKVRQELKKPDPDINIIEGDILVNGHDEWGTKFGWPVADFLDEDEDLEKRKKMSRK